MVSKPTVFQSGLLPSPRLSAKSDARTKRARHVVAVLLREHDQHREVGIFAAIILEIGHLPVEVIFAQHDMAESHGKGGIGALLRVQPEIGELGGFRIVGADDDRLCALVAGFSIEMRVGRAGLRNVGAPQHEETGIVPVCRFRHVCLLAPGHGRSRRKIAIPVVEGHADAAEQRQITRARRIGNHRHGRDRREANHAVRAIGLGRIGVGGGDDLVDLIPCRPHKAAEAAHLHIIGTLGRVLLDGSPCGHRRLHRAFLAPQLQQARADQRIFHAVGRVDVPAIARPARTAARFVVRQIRAGARIVGLLGFPGDDAALDIDLPRAGAGAVHAMGGAHDLVVLPAFAIGVFPITAFIGGDAVPFREGADIPACQEVQAVEE